LETKAHSAAQKETPKPYLFITSFGQLHRTKFARATAQVTAANNKKTVGTKKLLRARGVQQQANRRPLNVLLRMSSRLPMSSP
jgi:hypothetical protein